MSNETFDPLLVLPVVLSAVWVVWDLFYASYVLAYCLNFVLNTFILKDSKVYISEGEGIVFCSVFRLCVKFSVGKIRVSLLTGRIIFRDVHYYSRDNSFR